MMHALLLKEKLFIFRLPNALNFPFLTTILYSVYYTSNHATLVFYDYSLIKITWSHKNNMVS